LLSGGFIHHNGKATDPKDSIDLQKSQSWEGEISYVQASGLKM
jgi:hypothetical protein